MEGLEVSNINKDGMALRIPYGYVVDMLVRQKLGSAGTYDPLDLRERVLIKWHEELD